MVFLSSKGLPWVQNNWFAQTFGSNKLKVLMDFSAVPGERSVEHERDMLLMFVKLTAQGHTVDTYCSSTAFADRNHTFTTVRQTPYSCLDAYDVLILLGGNTPELHNAVMPFKESIRHARCHVWGISAGAIVLTHLSACAVKNADKWFGENGTEIGTAADYYANAADVEGPFFDRELYVPHMNADGTYRPKGPPHPTVAVSNRDGTYTPKYTFLKPEHRKLERHFLTDTKEPMRR